MSDDEEDDLRQLVGPRYTLAEEVNPRSLPLFVLALGLSCLAAYKLLHEPDASFPWLTFALHALASLLAGGGIAIALGPEETARHGWAAFLGVFAFLAGPVGVVLGIASYLVARGQPTRLPLTEVVKAEMFVTVVPEEEPEELTTMDLRIREQSQVEPFVDMLPVADIPTAIAIVNRLRERGQRQDIELIRQVTSDPRPEVYQYALAILDKMEREFAARVYALQQEIAEHPKRASLRVSMAKLHTDYMQSGLLDESLREYYWELSLSHLFEAMLTSPQNAELGADLAQLLNLQGLSEEAGAVATVVLKKDPGKLQAQFVAVQAIYDKALREENLQGVFSARKTALESAWAVKLPKRRTPGQGVSYDLAHFWFGERDA